MPRRTMPVHSVAFALLLSMAAPGRLWAAAPAKLVQVAPQAFGSKQPLLGYLSRPFGRGPFPAVVLLHGCGGFGPRETHWADRLRLWGYVALAVDSFTPRNMTGCAGPTIGTGIDGFADLRYLTTQPFVLPDRVAVLGSSLGGIAALNDVEDNVLESRQHLKFHAAVAFDPSCTIKFLATTSLTIPRQPRMRSRGCGIFWARRCGRPLRRGRHPPPADEPHSSI